MAEMNDRIEQFRKMTEADPDNELGHFSLGRAYLEAGEFDGAIAELQRTIDLNANMSRAYELLSQALLKRGRKPEAIDFLTRGVKVANDRGDVMPKNAMIRALQDLQAPVPELAKIAEEQPLAPDQIKCHRCGRVGPKLPSAPFRNPQGQAIHEKICAPCWREWIGMGTKVINELRLPLSDPQAQKIYDQHMLEFLNMK